MKGALEEEMFPGGWNSQIETNYIEYKAKAISAELLELNFGQKQWYFGQIQFFLLEIQWYFGQIKWYFRQI